MKTSNNRFITKLITVVALVLLLFLISCSGKEKEIIPSTKIGVIAPLTGNAAELGQHIQRGLELANADLGNKYELLYEDDRCIDTKLALGAAHKLIQTDKVKYVIGPLCAPAYQAVSGLFNENEVSFIHTSAVTPPFVVSSDNYGVPGLTTTLSQEDAFLADFIYHELDLTKMAVFVWDEEWAVEHRNGFVKRYTELGGEIVFDETFSIGDTDFRTAALKLQDAGAQGVFIVALNFQNANIVRQFNDLNIDIPIFGQFEIEDPAFLNGAGETAEGVIYVYPKIDTTRPEVRRFVETYKTTYGGEPNYYAYIGYDSLRLYDEAIKRCGEDTRCTTTTILSTKNFAGVSGLISFNADKTLSREFEIKTIRDGMFVRYE